ncbi:hypothetical protein [Chitinimonas sp.]|uniref:hypothetical protein n=1 Tax=Chitinimonas sp. TaxID=1934313 RepID=UPI0035AE6DAF
MNQIAAKVFEPVLVLLVSSLFSLSVLVALNEQPAASSPAPASLASASASQPANRA